MRLIGCVLLSLPLLMPGKALACRCAQQTLAEYFAAAEQVVMARLVASSELADRRRLEFELVSAPYRGDSTLRAGDAVTYLTERSTATCGIQPDEGAIYVAFGRRRGPDGDDLWLDSCSGTRAHISGNPAASAGFEDVPARFVARQLIGLAGMDILREVAAHAPDPASPNNTSLIGLLQLGFPADAAAARLHEAPQAGAATFAEADRDAVLETREYGYEQSGAVVYATAESWFRVGLSAGGFGWLRSADAGEFRPYPEITVGRLSYLNRYWSGMLWPDPGAGLPTRSSLDSDRQQYPVNVLEVAEIGGMPWLRVERLDAVCTGAEPRVVAGGWLPAYGTSGEPTTWFYSRGC